MKSKKQRNILLVALAVMLLVSLGGCSYDYGSYTADNSDAPFYKDRVVTVQFLMTDEDWTEMKGDPGAEAYAKADMWYDGELVPDVALRPKGNSSLRQAISGGTIKFGLKVDINFFNSSRHLDSVKKLNFSNGFSDPTFLREILGYEIFEEMGLPTPRTAFVDIWVNEDHLGVYTMVEQIDATFLENHFSDGSGYLYKPELASGSLKWTEAEVSEADFEAAMAGIEDINMGGAKLEEIMDALYQGERPRNIPENEVVTRPQQYNDEVVPNRIPENLPRFNQNIPGLADNITPENRFPEGFPRNQQPGMEAGDAALGDDRQAAEIRSNYLLQMGLKTNEENPDYSGLFALLEVLNNTPDESYAEEIEQVLDVDQALRFLAVSDAIVHLDNYIGMGHNYYLYEVDGKFTILPWDLNMAFGTFNAGLERDQLINYYIDEPSTGAVAERPLLRLLEVPEYLETYHGYLEEIINGPLASEQVNQRIDELADLVRPYVLEDDLKFYTDRQFELSLDADPATSERGGGGGMRAYGLKSFIRERVLSIAAQLSGELPSGSGEGLGNGGTFNAGGNRQAR